METRDLILTIFVAVTSVAVVIQMAILLALYLSVKKTNTRVNALADKFESVGMPMLESARTLVVNSRPKIEGMIESLSSSTQIVSAQIERLDATVTEVVDRTRLQVIRADQIVTRTMDRVEETSDLVHNTVMSPMRQLSGLLTGVMAGLGTYVGGRKEQRTRRAVPQDEMFI
jgi:methyl-accepting chemotaxis protein